MQGCYYYYFPFDLSQIICDFFNSHSVFPSLEVQYGQLRGF